MSRLQVGCIVERHEKFDGCWNCCSECNYDRHVCLGCGNDLTHDGREASEPRKGEYHFDCLGEYEIRDGLVIGLTGFGEQTHPNGIDLGTRFG